MIKLKQTVLVEGKYDKIRLSALVDANIIVCGGFGIFKNERQLEQLRRLAQTDGLLILTDSDRAGFQIRGYVKGCIPQGKVYHAYIPEVQGKEKRKLKPGKEGILGVEGMEEEALLQALKASGVLEDQQGRRDRDPIRTQDIYEAGMSGRTDSHRLRQVFLDRCGLPTRMSVKEMARTLSAWMEREEFFSQVELAKKDLAKKQRI